jgi:hypothetical protein
MQITVFLSAAGTVDYTVKQHALGMSDYAVNSRRRMITVNYTLLQQALGNGNTAWKLPLNV